MKTASFALAITLAFSLSAPAMAQSALPAPIVVTGKYQRDWQRGSRLEAEGLKELEQAQKDQVSASAAVVNAQNRRDSSQQRSSNAAEEYRRLTATTPPQTTAREALRWANDVQKAAASWSRFDERGSDGNKDLDKAMSAQRKAQQSIDKAEAKVARGRDAKAEAERQSTAASN